MTRLTSIQVENSGQLLGLDWPFELHFSAKNCSEPLRRSQSALIQEALLVTVMAAASSRLGLGEHVDPFSGQLGVGVGGFVDRQRHTPADQFPNP